MVNVKRERLFLLRQYKKALRDLSEMIRLELEAIEADLEDFQSSEAMFPTGLNNSESQSDHKHY